MTKAEFYKAVAEKTGMTIKDTKTVFETAQEVLFNTVATGEEVKMFDGVTFQRFHKEARNSRNPRTGEMMVVPAKNVPKVKFGKMFKDAVA